jgi:hypothetical protein
MNPAQVKASYRRMLGELETIRSLYSRLGQAGARRETRIPS